MIQITQNQIKFVNPSKEEEKLLALLTGDKISIISISNLEGHLTVFCYNRVHVVSSTDNTLIFDLLIDEESNHD